MKNVFIICVSKDPRGAKIVFVNFLNRLLHSKRDDIHYFLFCSWEDIHSYECENITVVITKRDGLKGIMFHDRNFYKKWSLQNNIIADVVVSMQNTTINYFKGVRQIVLFQQSVPLSDIQWNPFIKSERSLFFYKNIYPYFIKRYFTADTIFVAPTNWVKEKLASKLKIPIKNIVTIYSEIIYTDASKIIPKIHNDSYCHFIYPSNGSKHKNHTIIIEAVKFLRDTSGVDISDLRIHFTVDKEGCDYLVNKIKRLNLEECFYFDGNLPYHQVLSFYKSANALLFPSLIESFGLPLIEAAQFGLPVLTVDLPYAREVLSDYEGVSFLPLHDPSSWARGISMYMTNQIRFNACEIKFETGLDDFIKLIHKSL